MSNGSKPLALDMKGVCRNFVQGHKELHVLKGIDLQVKPGELVALVGASGSGKSTLLQLAGLLDRQSAGQISIGGTPVSDLKDDARSQIRRSTLGFVYQFHHLLPDFSALENVQMALRIGGIGKAASSAKAAEILQEMGLGERLDHNPAELSGGEQQRVAIARAVVANPTLLLADEPTGNLDEDTAGRVFEHFVSMVRERGLAAVIATHDRSLADRMDRKLFLHGGQLQEA